MHAFSYFTIVLAYCIYIPTTIKAGHYFDSSVSAWNYALSDRFFPFNGADAPKNVSADEWDIEEGCKCMNGRCEKLCVKERNGVCRKTSNVCVCGPEYFKANDETCINCECGKGFNCTFYHVTRTCTCPEGFYIRDDKCAALCDESHPCQNGGKCIDGKCQCKTGTSGAFCESPDRCEATCNQPLLVECVYNEEKEDVYCLCKNRSLVYDFELGICKPCLCGAGLCESNNGTLICNCDPGYQEFNGQCRSCNCGNGGICEISRRGEKICKCKDGDFAREGNCIPCDCGHKDAKCKTNKESRKECICPYGFEDILGQCIKMNKDDRRCLCHPTANCVETSDGEFNCTCNEGYKGRVHEVPQVGEECIDIDECKDSKTCPDRETTECFNFDGSYMCRCKTGYQPVGTSSDPRKTACQKYKISWTPTGVAIGIIIAFIAISVGILLFLKHRSKLFSSSAGIEMQYADLKR
ncbi:neurogenic locus notch homolog protein 1-like [Argiope bruennichi]|uniref:neurogenic locus notch homolog protein 1-like n=1 Tax=Argiope bruennichi TaxID=94029 RepID=UPI002494B52D|nr:neurogenic locus notch homolog protein 1-like [Argiope bruennichi]